MKLSEAPKHYRRIYKVARFAIRLQQHFPVIEEGVRRAKAKLEKCDCTGCQATLHMNTNGLHQLRRRHRRCMQWLRTCGTDVKLIVKSNGYLEVEFDK